MSISRFNDLKINKIVASIFSEQLSVNSKQKL